VVAARLGHSSVGMTLNRYSHVTPSIEADAAVKPARLMARPRPIVTEMLHDTVR
jgi:hypothetical protein